MRTDELVTLVTEIRAAHAALEAAPGRPHDPEWDAYFELKRRWEKRPLGRDAAPGDLCGPQLAGEWPNGGDIRCRRCYAVSGLEGHPYGCPLTPHAVGEVADALRRCYCGGTLVVASEIFGEYCANTPPVPVPGGCRWCGSNLCRVGDPDDQPEKQYDVPERPTPFYVFSGRSWSWRDAAPAGAAAGLRRPGCGIEGARLREIRKLGGQPALLSQRLPSDVVVGRCGDLVRAPVPGRVRGGGITAWLDTRGESAPPGAAVSG